MTTAAASNIAPSTVSTPNGSLFEVEGDDIVEGDAEGVGASAGEGVVLFEQVARTVTVPKPFKESRRAVDDGRWRPY